MADPKQMPVQILKQLHPFNNIDESKLPALAAKGRLQTLGKGKILFKRGEKLDAMVYLLQGKVDLADENFNVTPVVGGSDRGRRALDGTVPFSVTCVTTEPSRVFVIRKSDVDAELKWDSKDSYMVSDVVGADDEEEEVDWMESLLSSAMFAAVPPAKIQQLFARFEEVQFTTGDVVVKQGDPGDYFYTIKNGKCRITRRVSQGGEVKEVPLAEIGSGDMFGEDALIGDAPRNATVSMISDGTLMRLGQDDFEDLLQNPVLDLVSWEELQAELEAGAEGMQVLDVRQPSEFKVHNIEGSINLALHAIRQNLDKLDENTVYVLTCDGGRRSILASYILNQEGYEARVLTDPPQPESEVS